MELWVAKKRKISKTDKLIRFIRVEQLDSYLKDGWKVLDRGTEMVTIYRK
jgi:uncharacterized protein YfaT (DUF1175 family)